MGRTGSLVGAQRPAPLEIAAFKLPSAAPLNVRLPFAATEEHETMVCL